MASIGTDPNGRRRILFVGGDGKRRTVRLGKVSQRQAEAFKARLEVLVGRRITGAMDDDTARWVAGLEDDAHGKLAAVGLVPPRSTAAVTVGGLLDKFFEHLDVKPITSMNYQSTRKALLARFGSTTPVRDVDPLGADEWRAGMKAEGLAEATISKRVLLARQIFKQAVRWKPIQDNPFAGVRAGSQMHQSRQRFIGRADAQKVLDACPDAEWRLLFALSRYGGLRCPSEHLGLRWADVDWANGRLRVTSTKTERHAGRHERFVPIFPELLPYLRDAFEGAEAGAEWVIGHYRQRNVNMRTQLERIITRAGLTAWPRLFHNLRSTRQTELGETFPAHVVCGWIGNTERVAQNHYLQTTDEHFKKAVTGEGVPAARSAAQNQAQHTQARAGTGRQRVPVQVSNTPVLLVGADGCGPVPGEGIAATGFEPVTLGL